MLREIRKDQPSLAVRHQMLRQPRQESPQHRAFRVVDCILQERAGARRKPRRVTDDECSATLRKQVRLHDIDSFRDREPLEVLARALQRAWVEISCDQTFDTTPGQYGCEHTSARTDIESNIARCTRSRQRRRAHEVYILATDRCENPKVRMNSAARLRNVEAFDAPLVRTDHTEQCL